MSARADGGGGGERQYSVEGGVPFGGGNFRRFDFGEAPGPPGTEARLPSFNTELVGGDGDREKRDEQGRVALGPGGWPTEAGGVGAGSRGGGDAGWRGGTAQGREVSFAGRSAAEVRAKLGFQFGFGGGGPC